MNKKIALVIKREYITRVRNRSFILSTILLPLVFILFMVGSVYLSMNSDEIQRIAVKDGSGVFQSSGQNDKKIVYDFEPGVTEDNFEQKGFNALLIIPSDYATGQDSIKLVSAKQLSIMTEEKIRDAINTAFRNQALLDHHIDKALLDSINKANPAKTYKFNPVVKQGAKTEASNAGLSYIIGFGSGMLIYLVLLIYGASVMRGVMEEKTNRIAEVIISSVRPFQLMIGKIVGIAAVGLTQLLIWLILILVFAVATGVLLDPGTLGNSSELQQALSSGNQSSAMQFMEARELFLSAGWGTILPAFLFYFLGGYLFYASMFAAVGSVVNEDPQEAQALTLPITMPIILSFIVMAAAINNPNSQLAVWGSMIPFSSPIVMMARLPSGNVPMWELLVSMAVLAVGFIFTTWLAAKIYRTGILLYGKKVTLKEMAKWAFRKM